MRSVQGYLGVLLTCIGSFWSFNVSAGPGQIATGQTLALEPFGDSLGLWTPNFLQEIWPYIHHQLSASSLLIPSSSHQRSNNSRFHVPLASTNKLSPRLLPINRNRDYIPIHLITMSDVQDLLEIPKDFIKDGTQFMTRCTKRTYILAPYSDILVRFEARGSIVACQKTREGWKQKGGKD